MNLAKNLKVTSTVMNIILSIPVCDRIWSNIFYADFPKIKYKCKTINIGYLYKDHNFIESRHALITRANINYTFILQITKSCCWCLQNSVFTR